MNLLVLFCILYVWRHFCSTDILLIFESTEHHQVWLTWWRHQMETFSMLLSIRAGNSPVPGEFTKARDAELWCFDLHLKKWLSKQWWGWWFETPVRPLWRHCNEVCHIRVYEEMVQGDQGVLSRQYLALIIMPIPFDILFGCAEFVSSIQCLLSLREI